jgi:hypothetical protein
MGSGQFDKAGILAADFSGLEAGSPGFEVRFNLSYAMLAKLGPAHLGEL